MFSVTVGNCRPGGRSSLVICNSDHCCWSSWCSVLVSVLILEVHKGPSLCSTLSNTSRAHLSSKSGKFFFCMKATYKKQNCFSAHTSLFKMVTALSPREKYVLLQVTFPTLLFRSRVSKPLLSQMVRICRTDGL